MTSMVAAREMVAFGLDGVSHQIDLHNKKAAALRKSLVEVVARVRQIRSGSSFGRSELGDPAAAHTTVLPMSDHRALYVDVVL